MKTRVILLLSMTLLGACTRITVSRIDPQNPGSQFGIRYSLPKPFILVTPAEDGSVAVDVLTMPDPDNTYAIDTYSYFSTHSLDIAIEKGMLQRVGAVTDSTQVVSDAVKASGSVAAEILKEQATAAQSTQTALQTAQSNLATAETNLGVAQAKLDQLQTSGANATEILNAKLSVAEMKVRRDSARAALDRVRRTAVTPAATSFTASTGGGATISSNTQGSSTGLFAQEKKVIKGNGKQAVLGPVLFAVDERVNAAQEQTIVLRAVENNVKPALKPGTPKQPAFGTVAVWEDKPPVPNKIGLITVLPVEKQATTFDLTSSSKITKLAPEPLDWKRITPPAKDPKEVGPAVSLENGTTIHVDVTNMPKGDYEIKIAFFYQDRRGEELKNDWIVRFRIL